MKKNLPFLLFFVALSASFTNAFAQLTVLSTENIYGGRINAITGIKTGLDTSRIFIATESANSLFYADAYVPAGIAPIFGSFTALPGADASSGYGGAIKSIAAHKISGKVFFIHNNILLSTHPSSTAVNTVALGVNAFTIKGSTLLYTSGSSFYWGTLDGTGSLTINSGAPIVNPLGGMGMTSIVINKIDSLVYLFQEGGAPQLFESTAPYTNLTSMSAFSNISPTTLTASYSWKAFGIAPDGRKFIGGGSSSTKFIAYSDTISLWNEIPTGINGTSGSNIAFAGDSTNYTVYYASIYSDLNGTSSWDNFGTPGGFETHPNDGAVFADPNNVSVVYMTTDQGIGASHTSGSNIYEIDNGVEAVQVKDIDMTADKNTAWIASKSGIREVTNYQSVPTWTNAMFPNGDGSPYYSVAMINGNASKLYAGNARIYKTNDAGTTWTMSFSAEATPYSFNSVGFYVKALEVCHYNSDIVFAGYYAEGTAKGGLFYTMDAGASWNQVPIEATALGQDVDVRDIIFNIEGADTVAYIGVEYDLSAPQGKSVYRLVKNNTTWNVSQNFDAANTTVGYQITATINDLYRSVTGDTLYACGTDAGLNEPHVYSKKISGLNKWAPFPVIGFPNSPGSVGKAFTLGNDTAYCAVDNEIYYYPLTSSLWTLGYTYPVGNEINFLYFDELLVGTGTGLQSQRSHSDSITTSNSNKLVKTIELKNQLIVYPNPIKNTSTISYSILSSGNVLITLNDITGREIKTLVNEKKTAGTYTAAINMEQLAKGIYIVKLVSGNSVSVQEIVKE